MNSLSSKDINFFPRLDRLDPRSYLRPQEVLAWGTKIAF